MTNKVNINRVPQIIFIYWIIKISSTTLGETGADMFSMTMNFGYGLTIFIFLALFLVSLTLKLSLKRYETYSYWLTFTATAILGTAISDYIDRTLGLGYILGSLFLFSLLIITLVAWHLKEKSLSVENINTLSAEFFYWLAFLIANTLGTAVGDLLADQFGFGFEVSAIIISALLGFTILFHYKTKISDILLFWVAFVLTRPFGATFGDLLTKSPDQGGLGFGTITSSIFFFFMLLISLALEKKGLNKNSN